MFYVERPWLILKSFCYYLDLDHPEHSVVQVVQFKVVLARSSLLVDLSGRRSVASLGSAGCLSI